MQEFPRISPMLAEPHGANGLKHGEYVAWADKQGGYTFDFKWDGVRCIAYCAEGHVVLINRNGVDISDRYPDVVETLVTVAEGRSVILDGEIVAFADDGKPNFSLVAKRDRVGSPEAALSAAATIPVTYVAFDLLHIDGNPMVGAPFIARRAVLEANFSFEGELRERLFMLSPCSANGAAMWAFVQQQGLEGLIVKRDDSPYRSGRYAGWVKAKDIKTGSAVVLGYEPGKGSKQGMVGALILGAWDQVEMELVEIGKVGTGFDDATRTDLREHIDEADPYDPMGPDALVVEVEFLEFTRDGRLRFPSFKGVRTDVGPYHTSANINQFTNP